MVPQPEQQARNTIDKLLAQAGWSVCDATQANIHASRGVAIREFPLKSGHGFADYLLYVDGKAAGVILWAQVLEYFDASLIGFTATPSKQTFGFFHQNLAMQYSHEKAEAVTGKHPVDVCPAERAGHERSALGFRAERDARAKRHTHNARIKLERHSIYRYPLARIQVDTFQEMTS